MHDGNVSTPLVRATERFVDAQRLLATGPEAIANRVHTAVLACGLAGIEFREMVPAGAPAGWGGLWDIPDDLQERMRLLAVQVDTAWKNPGRAGAPMTSKDATNVAAEVVEIGAALVAEVSRRRRHEAPATQLAAVSQAEYGAEPTEQSLLISDTWSEEHLVVLGRIVELSAILASRARRLLGRALGIPENGLGNRQYIDAVFLGSHVKDISRRIRALSQMDDLPAWLPEAVDWARRAAAAEDRRDALIHRAPTAIRIKDGWAPGMAPARRDKGYDLVSDQAKTLLRELYMLSRERIGSACSGGDL